MREPVGCACDEAVPWEGWIVRRMLAGATVTGGAVAVYALLVRSRCLQWGTTGQESGGPLPGDDLIADPGLTATRAITVCAPASGVWPWIAQRPSCVSISGVTAQPSVAQDDLCARSGRRGSVVVQACTPGPDVPVIALAVPEGWTRPGISASVCSRPSSGAFGTAPWGGREVVADD